MEAKPLQVKARELLQFINQSSLKVPRTIVFGKGQIERLCELVFPLARGKKALVLFGGQSAHKSGLADRLVGLIKRCSVPAEIMDGIASEPTVDLMGQAMAHVRSIQPGVIISVGGGSVIDTGKAIAALATNEGSVEDYLEGVGKGLVVTNPPIPHVAVPTVAGTGAEMTRNAVICSPEQGWKKSMRSELMIPHLALIDPQLTVTVPPAVTAAGGMDTVTQLIEPCISVKRRQETTMLAHEGLRMIRKALLTCYEAPANLPAREQVSLASMLSGICLANSGLAMAHGIAAALGALCGVRHGLACGILLPHTLKVNRTAASHELGSALAALLNQPGPTAHTIDEGIAIEEMNQRLGIPPDLTFLELSEDDVDRIAQESSGTSMSGNPIPMTPSMILEFLQPLV